MSNPFHPEFDDPAFVRELARRNGVEEPMDMEAAKADAWQHMIDHPECYTSAAAPEAPSADPIERLRLSVQKREVEDAKRREQARIDKQTEMQAARTMAHAWRHGEPANAFRRFVAQQSIYAFEPDEGTRQSLAHYESRALSDMVASVALSPLGKFFSQETLVSQAAGFIRRFRSPVDGSGGSIPHEVQVSQTDLRQNHMPSGASHQEACNLWADLPTQFLERLQAEEQHRIATLNGERRRNGYGAIGYYRGY